MAKPKTINGSTNGEVSRRRKSREDIKTQVLSSDPTKDYQYSRTNFWGETLVQQLPPWRLWTGRMMLDSDPLVTFGLNVRNAALMPAEIEVKCQNPLIKKWIEEQWDFVWNHYRVKMTSAKEFGYAALQVNWKLKDGLMIVKSVKDFAPEDSRCLQADGKTVGMTIKSKKVFFPQALWLTFDSKYGNVYGKGCLRRMYPAWYEKWMEHGSQRLRQLRMIKDAYIGDIFWYPMNMLVELPDGTKMPFKDLMRELGENRLSGGALTLPRVFDDQGNQLTDYTPPQDVGGGSQIFEWGDSNDIKILQGADVPMEVIQASETGSGYSGRSIPFLTMLSVCNSELGEIVKAFDECILRPGAWLNWGGDVDYEIKALNLVETFSDDTQGSPMGGSAIGGQPSSAPTVIEAPPEQFSEDYYKHDIPHGGLDHWNPYASDAFHGQKEQHIPVDKIRATDVTHVAKGQMEKLKKPGTPPPVHVVHHKGTYYLHDGHHRTQHAIESKHATIPAKVIESKDLHKYGPDEQFSEIPPQKRIPETGVHPAVVTDDGTIHVDEGQKHPTHVHFIKHLKIPAHRVTEGGWVKDGVYEGSHRSDAGRYGEQARAKMRVEAKRRQARGEQFRETTVVDAYDYKPTRVHSGYGLSEAKALLENHGKLRGLHHEKSNKTYLWDASKAHHAEVAKRLKLRSYKELNYDHNDNGLSHKKMERHWNQYHSPKEELVGAYSEQFGEGNKRTLHAPPGGVTIHGVRYEGGEFIPKEVLERLTPEERSQVEAGSVARHIKKKPHLSEEVNKLKKRLEEEAIEEYGITNDPHKAGFILSDGRLLDFAGFEDNRSRPHEHIENLPTIKASGSKAIDQFIKTTGAARIAVHDKVGIDAWKGTGKEVVAQFSKPPSQEQLQWLVKTARKLDRSLILDVGKDSNTFTRPTVEEVSNWLNKSSQHSEDQNFSTKDREHHEVFLRGEVQFNEGGIPSNGDTFQYVEETEGEKILREFLKSNVSARIEEVEERINALRTSSIENLSEFHLVIEKEVKSLLPLLRNSLVASNWKSTVEGIADVVEAIPKNLLDTFPTDIRETIESPTALTGSIAPPVEPPSVPLDASDGEGPVVRFPIREEAISTLRASRAIAGIDYRDTANKVREGAFSVTTDLGDKAVEEIREVFTEALEEGHSRDRFIGNVLDKLGDGALSESHLETVFRTNAMTAYSNGKMKALTLPMVADAFPYVYYSATHDARVRPEHLELESLGLDGTNLYNANDPTFLMFRPPWSYNCRCTWFPQTVDQAAKKGVKEAKDWMERATARATTEGGDWAQYLLATAPTSFEYVKPPDFKPSPEFTKG